MMSIDQLHTARGLPKAIVAGVRKHGFRTLIDVAASAFDVLRAVVATARGVRPWTT
jgi:hypothetical protein